MNDVTSDTPNLDTGKSRIDHNVPVPASFSLSRRLSRWMNMTNYRFSYAKRLMKMILGGYSVLFCLGFSCVSFLFNDCVSCANFLHDRPSTPGGPCCGCVATAAAAVAAAALVVKSADRNKLANVDVGVPLISCRKIQTWHRFRRPDLTLPAATAAILAYLRSFQWNWS